jgi:hypothetical protein
VGHDEHCGKRFADHKTRHKVLHMGYYWPPIFKDAKKYVQAFYNCQRKGRPNQDDEIPLQAQVVVQSFERRALDFFGPFNPKSNEKSYILVATNYMTKWLEAMALQNATEEEIIQLLFELFVRYGLPREVITDEGSQFTTNKISTTLLVYKYVQYISYTHLNVNPGFVIKILVTLYVPRTGNLPKSVSYRK